jgi:chemotaxis protein histidine kinase CheA
MEAMTPEERFTRIENVLETLTENHLRHNAAICDLIVVSRTTLNAIGELRQGQKEFQETSRILQESMQKMLESQQKLQESQQKLQESQIELQESQKATEDKLHILIETVDRIIRNRKE